MVEILFWILMTYVITLGIDLVKFIIVTKDCSDIGYKIKYHTRLGSYYGENNTFNYRYIPVVNMIKSLKNFINYNRNKDNTLRKNIFNGLIEPLTDKEKEKLEKNNTAWQAFKINIDSITEEKMAEDLAKKFNVPVTDAYIIKQDLVIDAENIITYELNMKDQEAGFKISSSKGEIVNKLTKDKQLELVNEYMEMLNQRIEEYVKTYYQGDKEKFEHDLLNDEINLDSLKEEIRTDYLKDALVKKLK